MSQAVPEFGYENAAPKHTVAYLAPPVEALLPATPGRALDIGCGNGYWASHLARLGWSVVGIDASAEGIGIARKSFPGMRFEQQLIAPDLLDQLDEEPFDLVLSLEVVEHLYAPREWAQAAFNALRPGGRLVCSTPYHGYLKNLALSLAGKWDWHLKPLWDGGHIKFFSRSTLAELLEEAGFTDLQFRGAGRAPGLWMSMVMSGDRPR